MPPRLNQSGKPASTSAVITCAARDIFLQEGFEAASMDAIARRADVSKATLYAHFSNKEALFTAVMQAQRDDYSRQLDDLASDHSGNVTERLTRAGISLLSFMLSPTKLQMFRVVISESGRIPEICQTFVKTSREHSVLRIATLFQDGITSGQLVQHDSGDAARLFIAALRGDMVWAELLCGGQMEHGDGEIADRVSSVVQLFLDAYGKRELDKASP